jgi:hypothetical protein
MERKLALASIVLCLTAASPAFCQTDIRALQQAACEDDAYRLCPDEIPDENRVASCMARQKAKLSPACRAMFDGPARRRTAR